VTTDLFVGFDRDELAILPICNEGTRRFARGGCDTFSCSVPEIPAAKTKDSGCVVPKGIRIRLVIRVVVVGHGMGRGISMR